uniref:Uncharacterized protein n=2 Tax=Manihot esculenta TaxID=3983 RepID=A0A199UCI2_MANES
MGIEGKANVLFVNMVYNGYILVLDHHLSYLYGAFCDTFVWCYECETHCFLLFEIFAVGNEMKIKSWNDRRSIIGVGNEMKIKSWNDRRSVGNVALKFSFSRLLNLAANLDVLMLNIF